MEEVVHHADNGDQIGEGQPYEYEKLNGFSLNGYYLCFHAAEKVSRSEEEEEQRVGGEQEIEKNEHERHILKRYIPQSCGQGDFVNDVLFGKREQNQQRQHETDAVDEAEAAQFEPLLHGVVERECVEEWWKEAYAQGPQNYRCLQISFTLDLEIEEKAQVNEKNAQDDESENAVQVTLRIIGPYHIANGYVYEYDDGLNMRVGELHRGLL
jgi:hypothetical protein